jgi:hypothetical protein
MKVRKGETYSIAILHFRNLVVLTKATSKWVLDLQQSATCGVTIYDCTFRQAVDNLKILKSKSFDIQLKKEKL